MLGSLFLSAALAWLSCCENPRIDDPSFQAVYVVGNNAVAQDVFLACGPVDDEMCSDEPVTYPAGAARSVAIEFRVIHAPWPSKLEDNLEQIQFLSPSKTKAFLAALQSDPSVEVMVAPKMVLCSGQLGTLKIGHCPASGACCE